MQSLKIALDNMPLNITFCTRLSTKWMHLLTTNLYTSLGRECCCNWACCQSNSLFEEICCSRWVHWSEAKKLWNSWDTCEGFFPCRQTAVFLVCEQTNATISRKMPDWCTHGCITFLHCWKRWWAELWSLMFWDGQKTWLKSMCQSMKIWWIM